jgi:hypothetical protein
MPESPDGSPGFERELQCLLAAFHQADDIADLLRQRGCVLTSIAMEGRPPDSQIVVHWREDGGEGAEVERGVRVWTPDEDPPPEPAVQGGGHLYFTIMEFLDTGV